MRNTANGDARRGDAGAHGGRGGPASGREAIAWLRAALPRGGTLPDDIWRSRHRGILILLWLHLPALLLFAVARGNSWSHGFLEAGVVALPAMAARFTSHRRRLSTTFASVGLMTGAAVLVHLSGGVIEAHFLFFVMVGVVVLYQDWRPFLIAVGFVVVHHGAMGAISPRGVYNHEAAWEHPWTWAGIHGLSILAMSVAGIVSWKLNERSQAQLARLAAIVESSDDAIYGWTVDGTINSWNQGAVALFGYGRDEILGRSFTVLLPPGRAAEAEFRLEQIRAGRRIEPFESERERKDGSIIEVSVNVSSVRNAEGNVVGGATIARDITERRRADEALRKSQIRLAEAQSTARLGSWEWDIAEDRVTWSDELCNLFGVDPANFVATYEGYLQRVHPEDRVQAESAIGAAFVTREAFGFDHRVVRPDGAVGWIRSRGNVEVGADGAPARMSGTAADITEWVALQQERQHTLSLLAATLESTPDGLLVVGTDGRISSFNGKFAEMWRLPASALDSGEDSVAMALVLDQLNDPDAFLVKVMELYRQPEAESHDTIEFKDGRVFERSSKPQRVGGTVVGRVWSFHDVTGQRQLEAELAEARDRALESSRLKSEFLATMSHEIRTPMNGVIGLTGLLLDTALTDSQREYAEGVRASGEALLGIINDILDFSKIEAGKLELEMVDFDLAQALEEVANLVAEPARAKGLELVAYCVPDVPPMVRGDVGRLRQILLNLVSNAIKFTAAGEVVVRASLGEPTGGDQLMVHLEVADTGIGIAAATAERLFEPFSQADASTTRRYGGTGLGLAICRRLAEAMGGTIGLESTLGQGSTFWVDLPLQRTAVPVLARGTAGHALQGLRVLVVEENDTHRLVLAAQLLAWDIAADLVPDGFVAIERLRSAAAGSRPYDLALVDMATPGMDGLELARTIKADPALTSVRLLLLSSVDVEAEAAARAGFSVRLTKPARLSLLYDALVRAVAPPSGTSPTGTSVPSTRTAGTKGRLLIVEDNAINQAVAKGLAVKLGFGCDVAGNGLEALEALTRQHYDAVLMDCQMPEMDGFEATAEIRRREAGTTPVPIIAMTAGALVEDRERCLAAGMDDYLAKPVESRELCRVLDRWLPARS